MEIKIKEVVAGGGDGGLAGRSHKGTVWGHENVPYLDVGDAYWGVSICQKSSSCTLKICAFFGV